MLQLKKVKHGQYQLHLQLGGSIYKSEPLDKRIAENHHTRILRGGALTADSYAEMQFRRNEQLAERERARNQPIVDNIDRQMAREPNRVFELLPGKIFESRNSIITKLERVERYFVRHFSGMSREEMLQSYNTRGFRQLERNDIDVLNNLDTCLYGLSRWLNEQRQNFVNSLQQYETIDGWTFSEIYFNEMMHD